MLVTKEIKSGDYAGQTASCEFDLGESIQDPKERLDYLAEKYGAAVCASQLAAKLKITVQSALSRLIKAEKTQEEIEEAMADYKPTMGGSGGGGTRSAKTFEKILAAKKKEFGDDDKGFQKWLLAEVQKAEESAEEDEE